MKPVTVTTKEVESTFDYAKYLSECKTKSGVIRKLTEEGKTRSEVAKLMGIRYQHVRNVLITPIKKAK